MAAGGIVTMVPVVLTATGPDVVTTYTPPSTIVTPDYTAELALITAEIATLTATMLRMNTSLGLMAASLVAIESILIAVQTPTGDFRTKEVGVTTDNILVNTALTKSAIPSPQNTGI
jgi:hypothetical protein